MLGRIRVATIVLAAAGACTRSDPPTSGKPSEPASTPAETAPPKGPRSAPDAVATQIDGNDQYACARMSDGTVQCWGQCLFDCGAKLHDAHPPRVIAGVEGIAQVAVGTSFACARTDAGQVHCWGHNLGFALGNRPRHKWLAPDTVGTIPAVVDIVAGNESMVARTADGSLWVWGWVISRATEEEYKGRVAPRPAPSVGQAVEVFATTGDKFCARDRSDNLSCWGGAELWLAYDEWSLGKLQKYPASEAMRRWGSCGCSLTRAGQLTCEIRERPGPRAPDGSHVPGPLAPCSTPPIDNVEAFAVGSADYAGGCALLTDGTVTCWGGDHDGVGDAQRVPLDAKVSAIVEGPRGSIVALDEAGVVWTWAGEHEWNKPVRLLP